jgi:hypothetical protein
MFSKISVLVPTRGRPQRLRILLDSYARTADSSNSELVFRVDDDDPETQALLAGHRMHVGPRMNGYASLPTFFNELPAVATGDVFLCGNDDMVFVTHGWASALLAVANQYHDGLFDLGVMSFNHTHYPFSVVSRKAVETMGFLWDPRIFWGDMFLRDVMAAFGRCVPVHHVRIEHEWAGWTPDAVYEEGLQPKQRGECADYWPTVHQPAVADAVEKLQDLVERGRVYHRSVA